MIDHAAIGRLMLEIHRRNAYRALSFGRTVPWSIWQADVPDARCASDRFRSNIWNRRYGLGSTMYCTSCHGDSGYAISDSILKTHYTCPDCIHRFGTPGLTPEQLVALQRDPSKCDWCGDPAPFEVPGAFYRCNDCVIAHGYPEHSIPVPGQSLPV